MIGPQVARWGEALKGGAPGTGRTALGVPPLDALPADSIFRRPPNLENWSVAAEWWAQAGLPERALVDAAEAFALSDHRLAPIAERDGVRFWNDTKATNFHAALAAIEAVGGRIVWIGGGRGKGGDVVRFAQEVATRVEVAVVYGEMAPELASIMAAAGAPVHVEERFDAAVRLAASLAEDIPSAQVLLSPGFASFDQFRAYGERGKIYCDLVLSLKNANPIS